MRTTAERFWKKVSGGDVAECWSWTGAKSVHGYGRFITSLPATTSAHRWAYEALIADVPSGLVLDHLCRNRLCVNPWHLEPVSNAVNVLRGETLPAANRAKTACIHGHPFDHQNTHVRKNGKRECRTCMRQRTRSYRAAQALIA